MIKTQLPKGHPAQFIIDDLERELSKIETEKGKPFFISITLAHSLFQLNAAVGHLAGHGTPEQEKCGEQIERNSSLLFNAAMHNLTSDMPEADVELMLSMVGKMVEAERAVNAIASLLDKMPGGALKAFASGMVRGMVEDLQKQRDEARKNAH